jgi:hypothetical protein
MSKDGQSLVVGAPRSDENGKQSGSVRVFHIANGTTWVQKGDQINGAMRGDNCGYSVAMAQGGDIIAVGTPLSDEVGDNSGSVRVYKWSEAYSLWEQMGGAILGEPDTSDKIGFSISLNEEGNILAVGMPFNSPYDASQNMTVSKAGAAKIYEWIDDAWQQKGKTIKGQKPDDNAGTAVALNYDATILAVSSPKHDNSAGFHSGRVRVFEWDGSVKDWVIRGMGISGANTNDRAGIGLALSRTGNILAVGAPQNSDLGYRSGHVRVFRWTPAAKGTTAFARHLPSADAKMGTWEQLGSAIVGEGDGHRFGQSVSLSADGSLAAIGAPLYSSAEAEPNMLGRVGTYAWNGTDWSKVAVDKTGELPWDSAGWSVSLSADGTHLATGIIQYNEEDSALVDRDIKEAQLGLFSVADVGNDLTKFNSVVAASKKNSGNGMVRVYAIYKCEFSQDWWNGAAHPLEN